jgi:glycosyltransferase involved in cell wall biosynthesis
MTAPKKIAYLFQNRISDISSPTAAYVHISHILKGLLEKDKEVGLMALYGRQVIFSKRIGEIRKLDPIENHAVRLNLGDNAIYKLFERGIRRLQTDLDLPYFAIFDSLRCYEAYRKYLCEYDVVHERYNLLAVGGALGCKKSGIPMVLELNADPFVELKFKGIPESGIWRRFAEWTFRFSLERASKIICVSKALKEHMIQNWDINSEKIIVLPNAADIKAFNNHFDRHSLRRDLQLNGQPVVVFVGGFYPWHASLDLVRSFKLVVQQVPDACLCMVGDGPMLEETRTLAEELNLQHRVRFIGAVPHTDIPKWLSIADVAVAPYLKTDREIWFSPLKLFEYMASGRAIVASESGQVSEIIETGRNGILVQPGDSSHFSQAIIELLQDPEERTRLGDNARKDAIERYSWTQYAERLLEIYASVL